MPRDRSNSVKYVPSPHDRQYKSAPPRARVAAVPPPRSSRTGIKLLGVIFIPMLSFFLYQDGGSLLKRFAAPPPAEQKNLVENPLNDAEWQGMAASLDTLARGYRGRVGIYIKDLNSGKVWEYNPDRLFTAASLIKLPIMVSICEKIKSGGLSLDTQLKLTTHDRAGGSGSLKWVRTGTSLSVMEIIYKMITESDNTATKMLLDYAGFDYFQRTFTSLGLVQTTIHPEGMSLVSGHVAKENYTTAREMAGLMEKIYRGELVDKTASEFMLEVLKHNKSTSRLRKGLPLGWELGHKTGLLRHSCHDVGVVFSPRGDYVIAVLTGDVPDYSSAKEFITRVAAQTYRCYRTDSDFASAASARGPKSM